MTFSNRLFKKCIFFLKFNFKKLQNHLNIEKLSKSTHPMNKDVLLYSYVSIYQLVLSGSRVSALKNKNKNIVDTVVITTHILWTLDWSQLNNNIPTNKSLFVNVKKITNVSRAVSICSQKNGFFSPSFKPVCF